MATSNNRYDHPQYTVSHLHGGFLNLSAATGRRTGFTALADSIVRAVHIGVAVAGTNTALTNVGQFLGVKVTAAGALSTSTLAGATVTTFGSNTVGTSILSTTTLSRGDSYFVVNTGTDLGAQFVVGVEYTLIPGASYTS